MLTISGHHNLSARAALQVPAGKLLRAQVLHPSTHNQEDPSVAASHWVHRGAETLAVAFVYCALEILSHHFRIAGTQAWPLCLPCGFGLALLYRCGGRVGGGIFLGAFWVALAELYLNATGGDLSTDGVLQFLMRHPLQLGTSAATATGYTLEAIIGSALIRAFHSREGIFDDVRGVVVLCVSALASSAIGSGIAVTSQYFGAALPAVSFTSAWLASWFRHFVGILCLFPL